MPEHEVIQIVDTYNHSHASRRHTMKNDPDGEARALATLVKLLGRNPRKIAIVAHGDDARVLAYSREDYEIIKMNGDRDAELRKFISKMTRQIERDEPKHTVIVSDDPEFEYLCQAAAKHTDVAVWAHSETVPKELIEAGYNFRPLEDLLPDLKIPKVDVRVDVENIVIGLEQRDWQADLGELVDAINRATKDLGEIVTITGYADWTELARHSRRGVDLQRQFAMAGGESRYLVNQHGKNSADMRLADDVRTLVEHNQGSAGAVDVICFATNDRDFRPIIETAQRRGKHVVVLGLEGGVSGELRMVANEVRYLDEFVKLPASKSSTTNDAPEPRRDQVALMLRIGTWMHQHRLGAIYRDRLEHEFADVVDGVRELIDGGWFVSSPGNRAGANSRAHRLEPNREHTTARAALYLAQWLPRRLDFCLKQRGMPHVDTNYLANGMTRDVTLSRLGVAQTRKAAENWLYTAEAAGLVVHASQPHPQSPDRTITTWRPANEEPAAAAGAASGNAETTSAETTSTQATEADAGGAEISAAPPHSDTSHVRHLLTDRLSDGELTRLTFDYFRVVHREVDGQPRYVRIQALLDHAERRDQMNQLLAAIREVNPALSAESPADSADPQLLLQAA
jgi:uncharacterized LabA/DUF88 family protein